MPKSKTKADEIIDLMDEYLWCTRGSSFQDNYSIRDEEDFKEFKEALESLLSSSNN